MPLVASLFLVASLLLVVRPGATTSSSVLATLYPPTPAYSQSLGGEAPGTPQGEAVGQA